MGATCFTNFTRAVRGVQSRSGQVRHGLLHRRAHDRAEVGGEVGRIGDDVDRAQQRRRDRAQLVHPPVGADAAAVAGEPADHGVERRLEHAWRLAVLAVGEQDGVRAGARMRAGWSAICPARVSQVPIAVAPLARSRCTSRRGLGPGAAGWRSRCRSAGRPARRWRCPRSPRTRRRPRTCAIASAAARRAALIRSPCIDVEQSRMMISRPSAAGAATGVSGACTVTIASTRPTPAGR